MDHLTFAQLLGNYGEFVGAIAVVATLVYLAVQVRHSRDETARASRQSASTSIGDLLLRIALDQPTYTLFYAGIHDPDSLEEEQRFRFHMLFYTIFDQWETIFSNWRRGRVSQEDWDKWEAVIANYLTMPGVQVFWSRLSVQFTASFRDYINALEPDSNYTFK